MLRTVRFVKNGFDRSLMLTKAGLFDQKDSKTVILLQFSLHYLCFKQLCCNSLNRKFSNKIYMKYIFFYKKKKNLPLLISLMHPC